MTEATLEEAQQAPANGKSSRVGRLADGIKALPSKGWQTAKTSLLVTRELARTPFRCGGRVAHEFVSDLKRFGRNLAPTAIVGTPLSIFVVGMGLTPAVTPGALAARFVKSADTVMGSVAMGAVGFLAGTAIIVFAWELAVAYTVLEALLLVARAAEKVDIEQTRLATANA